MRLTEDELKQGLLEILCEFDSVCRKLGLRYSLYAGTLLGAVRHQGFIPWDDDIDVMMPRPDYERLLTSEEAFSSPFELAFSGKGGYMYPFAKLFDLRIRAQEQSLEGIYSENLWIDIFPVDGLASKESERLSDWKLSWSVCRRANILYHNPHCLVGAKGAVKRLYRAVKLPFATPGELYSRIDQIARKHTFEDSEYAGQLVWMPVFSTGWTRASDFDHLIEISFEGKSFLAIPHWHEFLSNAFGDYASLPPGEERKTHGITAWHL